MPIFYIIIPKFQTGYCIWNKFLVTMKYYPTYRGMTFQEGNFQEGYNHQIWWKNIPICDGTMTSSNYAKVIKTAAHKLVFMKSANH